MVSSLRITALLTAVIATLVIVAVSSDLPISAQADPVVSVDSVSDSSNTATTVGSIESCRSAALGESLKADVVIQGVTDLAGFQANLLYDASVLNVTAVDYFFLLASTGAVVIQLGDTVPDSDGDFLLAAAMFSIFGITGANNDGVLARVTLQAVGSGTSPLDLTNVKLADSDSNPIAPSDATGVYQGPVNDGVIAVDVTCPLLGDVDCSGVVTIDDAAWISVYNVGYIDTLPCLSAADVDCDGAVTIDDAAWISVYNVGFIDALPGCA